jgi:paraquat-inducible protein A
MPAVIHTCPCCGLAQTVPAVPPGMRACCARCQTSIRAPGLVAHSTRRTAAFSLAALILYPLAVMLPVLKVQQMGHHTESSILEGIATLLAEGQLIVGVVVLLCSVIFPLTKLAALLTLSLGGARLLRAHHHKAWLYHLIEWTGRWGMLDVLLVAILVAALKLGNMVDVTAGPGAMAFCATVVLSLLATASFDPHNLWETEA